MSYEGRLDSVEVESRCYKTERSGFETREDNGNLSVYLIVPAAIGFEVSSACSRNEY
jgi:hypothetical protein